MSVAEIRKCKQTPSRAVSKYLSVCYNLPESYGPHDGYHRACYSNFTAYSAARCIDTCSKQIDTSKQQETRQTRRSRDTVSPMTTSGVLIANCIFCQHHRTRIGKHFETSIKCATLSLEIKIKDAAKRLQDSNILKYDSIDYIAKEVCYHEGCRARFLTKADHLVSRTSSPYPTEALTRLMSFIEEQVLKKKVTLKIIQVFCQ